MPILLNESGSTTPATAPRVNIPRFEGQISYREATVFWFGQVTPQSNYADVRIASTADELWVNLGIIDRQLWYDPNAGDPLTEYDSATLYLNLAGVSGTVPGRNSFRFEGQLNWFEERIAYQAGYRGDGSGWQAQDLAFETTTGWRGGAPNDNTEDDRGWVLTFHIPFSSLGLPSAPPEGQIWGLAVGLSDRDAVSPGTAEQAWPPGAAPDQPVTWGQLSFGLPPYTPPPSIFKGAMMIRQGLNGLTVSDGEVGGGSICAEGLDFWAEWGSTPAPGGENNTDFNIQNQADIADWPCFAKYYLTFPLEALPEEKVIRSATLTLHQMGNSGGGDWGMPAPSFIQVMIVKEAWEEASLTWNNAPLAFENVSGGWVGPIVEFPGWPGIAREWDVSRAVAQAYAAGEPLRLAIYTADDQYHSGKYFVSSDTADWNAEGRPSLVVEWGE